MKDQSGMVLLSWGRGEGEEERQLGGVRGENIGMGRKKMQRKLDKTKK